MVLLLEQKDRFGAERSERPRDLFTSTRDRMFASSVCEALNTKYCNLVFKNKKHPMGVIIGAEDEIRTRDIRLGKATLYH